MSPAGIRTVARQEFRLRIRAGRWRLLLAIWFAILLLFTTLLRGAIGGFEDEEIVDKGIVVYGGLMLFVLGLALLVVPALAAQSVNGDRERGTLATLQVTRLTAADITLGKFAAAWGTSLVFLALTFPLVAYAITQKGVPVGRTFIVTLVLALLLGTVCAISLALSALLSRTTTSGVLAYLAVFALTIGTLITFGLVTAATTESFGGTLERPCPPGAEIRELTPGDVAPSEPYPVGCGEVHTFQTTRARTDRTWWLLAPNPFVVLADAAPRLPPLTREQRRARNEAEERGESIQDARDLDPLGGIGNAVRNLRRPPDGRRDERRPVWPFGLGFDVALACAALYVTTRRLTTPTRNLPKGQRVA